MCVCLGRRGRRAFMLCCALSALLIVPANLNTWTIYTRASLSPSFPDGLQRVVRRVISRSCDVTMAVSVGNGRGGGACHLTQCSRKLTPRPDCATALWRPDTGYSMNTRRTGGINSLLSGHDGTAGVIDRRESGIAGRYVVRQLQIGNAKFEWFAVCLMRMSFQAS